MSIQIQNWTRFDDIHPMFETKTNGDLKYIKGANHSRLDVDKTLAELVYMLQNSRNKTSQRLVQLVKSLLTSTENKQNVILKNLTMQISSREYCL